MHCLEIIRKMNNQVAPMKDQPSRFEERAYGMVYVTTDVNHQLFVAIKKHFKRIGVTRIDFAYEFVILQ